MIFVIPVSESDIDKLPRFVKLLQHFGGLRQHKVIIAPTANLLDSVTRITKPLGELFYRVDVVPVTFSETAENSWPHPCNMHFKGAILAADKLLDMHWMWLELDSVPLKEGWADDLNVQYNSAGKPFMGVLRDTNEVQDNAVGQHMVGFGIYPAQVGKYTSLWKYPSKTDPFDVFMRFDIVKWAHNTPLIAHAWGSSRYVSSEGVITGRDSFNSPVTIPKHAVILHGVKDESLARIILGEKSVEPKEPHVTAALSMLNSVVRKPSFPKLEVQYPEDVQNTFIGEFSIPQMIEILEKFGYKVSHANETVQPNGEQGEPATGETSHETKAETVASNVQLKKRGRPSKITN